MIQLQNITIDERTTPQQLEQIRRGIVDAIRELQQKPAANVLPGITLADGVETTVAHKLGRLPMMVKPSVVRGATSAGYIVELRDGTVDRSKFLKLKASGYGATITLDLEVQ